MPTTRKQQTQLQIQKTGEDQASLSTAATSTRTKATKRKQDKTAQEEGQSKEVGEEDVKAAARTEGSNGRIDKDHDGQPPAKSVKVDDEEGKKNEEHLDTVKQNKAENPKPSNGNTSAMEEKLDGKDVNASGPGDDIKWKVVERGHIYFFYRPKVQPASKAESDEPAATSIDDTQNTHVLLLPRASDSATAPAKRDAAQDAESEAEQTGEVARQAGIGARLIRLGKKRLPEPDAAIKQGSTPGGLGGDSSEAIWAVVSEVSPSFESLKAGFAERRYSTKTAGDRVVKAARPVGRGWYVISISQTEPPSSRQVRLSYALSHPHDEKDFGDVQEELGLHKNSSCLLQMRNPTLPATGTGAPPAGLDPSSRVHLSKAELDETFGGDAEQKGTNYARPENLDLLDRAGVELLMIKKRKQEEEDALAVGDAQEKVLKELAAQDASSLSNIDVLKELGIEDQNPPDALDGEWF